MPLEPSPYIKKAMASLGCDNAAPVEEADRVLRAFLSEAEAAVTARMANESITITPLGMLVDATRNLPELLVATKISAMTRIANGDAGVGIDSSPLSKLVAIIATTATMFLKDMAFVGGEDGIDGNCERCHYKDTCPTWIERNKNG